MSHKEMFQNRKKSYRHSVTGMTALIMETSRVRAAVVKLGMQLEADLRVRPIISPGIAKKLSKHHCNV